MTVEHKTFSHGYEFKNFAGQPQAKIIQIKIPEKIIIPLKQGFGEEVAPVVKVGQKVTAGQIIARDDESVSSPVHCTVNGTVIAIEKIDYLGGETTAITIQSDGTDNWQKLNGYSSDWQNLPVEKLNNLIYLSGASSAGHAGIPTSFVSSVIPTKEVKNVIIHNAESEVYNLSLSVLLKDEKLSHFTEGIKILKKTMPSAAFHLALGKSHKNLIEEIHGLFADDNSIDIYSLEPKYPVDCDEVLVPLLLGKEFPYGYSAANIGVIVLGVQEVLQVYEAVAQGKPLIERTVALCGPGFIENPHVKVRIGTPLEHIVEERTRSNKDLRFIRNSCMTGESLCDLSLPVSRSFNSIIALVEGNQREFLSFVRPGLNKDSYSHTFLSFLFKGSSKIAQKNCETNLHGEPRPCIFCTFCEEVCPAAVIPHLLYHYVEKDVIDETLINYKIFNCIECNLCSYVCPSKIPLSQYIKEGKKKLIELGCNCPEPDFAIKGLKVSSK